MAKKLEEMTLAELWELFPIIVTSHNPAWRVWADEEISLLMQILSAHSPVINHIGSTAIPDIKAKPIIDILVEVADSSSWSEIKETLTRRGYICMAESVDRMSFNKGYTPEGYAARVFHVHIHHIGDNDEIRFRDYLTEHKDLAKEYEALKLSLLPRFIHDRDGYTEAKTGFVRHVMELCGTPE